jgi:hypothetical protein
LGPEKRVKGRARSGCPPSVASWNNSESAQHPGLTQKKKKVKKKKKKVI